MGCSQPFPLVTLRGHVHFQLSSQKTSFSLFLPRPANGLFVTRNGFFSVRGYWQREDTLSFLETAQVEPNDHADPWPALVLGAGDTAADRSPRVRRRVDPVSPSMPAYAPEQANLCLCVY